MVTGYDFHFGKGREGSPEFLLAQGREHGFGVTVVSAQRDEADRLMQLASELPEAYRECVMLRCVRGMSYRAIASITGLAETTVETRIARGRRMLREIAQQQGKPQHNGQKQQVHA